MDTALIVVMLLSAAWVSPLLTRVVLSRDTVRDDFGYVVPYRQELLRRQTIELAVRLLFVMLVLATVANWRMLVDHVNEWANIHY